MITFILIPLTFEIILINKLNSIITLSMFIIINYYFMKEVEYENNHN